MKASIYLTIFFWLFCLNITFAQSNNKKAISLLREGNESYKKGDYTASEEKYQSAINENADYFKAKYNLANTLYKQKKYKEANLNYMQIIKSAPNKEIASDILYNMGNCSLMQKEYEASIPFYKSTLRINPKDTAARYNLAYALSMKNKQGRQQDKDQQNKDQQNKDQQNKNQQNKDQQNKDQQNKDQQNKDQQNKDQQNKDQQNKDQQNKDQQNKDQQNKDQQNKDQQNKDQQNKDQQNKDQQNKDQQTQTQKNNEQLLNAIAEKDRATKEKLDKNKPKGIVNTKIEQDW